MEITSPEDVLCPQLPACLHGGAALPPAVIIRRWQTTKSSRSDKRGTTPRPYKYG